MSALAAFQAQFLARVFADDGNGAELAIYRRNVLGTLGEALAAAHPAVRRLVGEAFFDEAARRHAIDAPSRRGDLNAFGGGFAAFLAAYPHAQGLPYLPDVARLEWAVHECFHAEDAPGIDAHALARVAPQDLERLRVRLHPAVRLLASRYAVDAVRAANLPGAHAEVACVDEAVFLLVRRDQGQVHVERLAAAEWQCLARIDRGERLAVACEPLGDAAIAVLARHAGAGTFAAFDLAPPG